MDPHYKTMVEQKRQSVREALEIASKLPEEQGNILRDWVDQISDATLDPKHAEAAAKLVTVIAGCAQVGQTFSYFDRPGRCGRPISAAEVEGIGKGINLKLYIADWKSARKAQADAMKNEKSKGARKSGSSKPKPPTQAERKLIAEAAKSTEIAIQEARNKIRDEERLANFESWVSEVKRKLKTDAYDVLTRIAFYYMHNEPFGAFTEPIGDPRTINKTDILKKYEEAQSTCKPMDQVIVEPIPKTPARSRPKKDSAPRSKSSVDEKRKTETQRAQSQPRPPIRQTSNIERKLIADAAKLTEIAIQEARNKIRDEGRLANFEKWVSEIKRKLKTDAYDVLTRIALYYKHNEPFGAFTEPIGDPRTINKTDILKKYEEAQSICKPMDQFIVEQIPKTPARSRPKKDSAPRSKSSVDEKQKTETQRAESQSRPPKRQTSTVELKQKQSQNEALIDQVRRRLTPEIQRIFDTWKTQIDNKIKDRPLNRDILKEIVIRMILKLKHEPFNKITGVDFTKYNKTAIIEAYQDLQENHPLPDDAEEVVRGAKRKRPQPQPKEAQKEPSIEERCEEIMLHLRKKFEKDPEKLNLYNSWVNYIQNMYGDVLKKEGMKVIYIMSLYKDVGIDDNEAIPEFATLPQDMEITKQERLYIHEIASRDIESEIEFCEGLREDYADVITDMAEYRVRALEDKEERERVAEILKKPHALTQQFLTKVELDDLKLKKQKAVTNLSIVNEGGEEIDVMEHHEASRVVEPDGVTTQITTGTGTGEMLEPGVYHQSNESRTVERETEHLGFELKYLKTSDLLNKINFAIYPEMKILYKYCRQAGPPMRQLVVDVINEIRRHNKRRYFYSN